MAIASLPQAETYFKLVQQFPLVVIKNDEHLAAACAFLDELLSQHLDEGGTAYLDTLTELVESYEDKNEPALDAPPEDVLRELIDANNLTQHQLAKTVGISQSTISDVLNGKRKPTAEHIKSLARHFNISPTVFLGSRDNS